MTEQKPIMRNSMIRAILRESADKGHKATFNVYTGDLQVDPTPSPIGNNTDQAVEDWFNQSQGH